MENKLLLQQTQAASRGCGFYVEPKGFGPDMPMSHKYWYDAFGVFSSNLLKLLVKATLKESHKIKHSHVMKCKNYSCTL